MSTGNPRPLSSLRRLESSGPLREQELEIIRHLPADRPRRSVLPIHHDNQDGAMKEWLANGYPVFQTPEQALTERKWILLEEDCTPKITGGAVAEIRMAYKKSEAKEPLESRHLTVAKIQDMLCHEVIWREVEILRGCVHENIVDIYDVFAIDSKLNRRPPGFSKSTLTYSEWMQMELWILLEYASAGSLRKEQTRYDFRDGDYVIPETGARYYMIQICAGLKYLHHLRIVHSDLHSENVILRYKRDGTKVCMLCDFGSSEILTSTDVITKQTWVKDIEALTALVTFMMPNPTKWSPETTEICSLGIDGGPEVSTVDEFLALSWMRKTAVAPIPKPPSPLLQPHVVEKIGYLPERDPVSVPPSDADASAAGSSHSRTRQQSSPVPGHSGSANNPAAAVAPIPAAGASRGGRSTLVNFVRNRVHRLRHLIRHPPRKFREQ